MDVEQIFEEYLFNAGTTGHPHVKEEENAYLTPYVKVNLTWMKDLIQE